MTKATVDRRRFLIGGAVAGVIGTKASAELHDGELGAPPATYRGAIPWQEGAADSPPGVSDADRGFIYFTPAEQAFITAAVARLIPNDEVGPGAVEANVPFFLDRQLAGPSAAATTTFSAARGPRAPPSRAIKADSVRHNSIVPRSWRSNAT